MQDVINFEREHQMGAYSATIYFPAGRVRHLFDQQLTAPFDDYILNAFVFVIDKATNESVHITRFAAADPLNNFVTFSRDTETTNKFAYDPGNGTVTMDVESRALVLTISRSVLARTFTICMQLVNWALTVGTLYITLVVLVRKEKVNDAVLALPITVVLTMPAIRALFIGTPPFGILIGMVTCNPPVQLPPRINLPFSRRCWILSPDRTCSVVLAGAPVRRCKAARVTTARVRGLRGAEQR